MTEYEGTPDEIVRVVAFIEMHVNRLIAFRLGSLDRLTIEIISERVVERLSVSERLSILEALLLGDARLRAAVGLSDDDSVRAFRQSLRTVFEQRNIIAHSPFVRDMQTLAGPVWVVMSVKRGKANEVFYTQARLREITDQMDDVFETIASLDREFTALHNDRVGALFGKAERPTD